MWHEGAGDHDEVAVEHADHLKQRVVARDDLARLDAGDVPLANPKTAGQVPLAPAALLTRLYERVAQFGGKRLWA